MNNVVSVQRLLWVVMLGATVAISGCSNDGSATSGSGHVFLPEDNQLPNDMSPPTATPGGTQPQNTTLSGRAELQVSVAGLLVAARTFTVTGNQSGNTLVISSGFLNGTVTMSGNRFTGSVRFALNSNRLDCDGTVTVTGTVSAARIDGQIAGTPSCSVDSAPPTSSTVTGRISG